MYYISYCVFFLYYLSSFEMKTMLNPNKARQIHVSTDDVEVKSNLSQLGEPICKK